MRLLTRAHDYFRGNISIPSGMTISTTRRPRSTKKPNMAKETRRNTATYIETANILHKIDLIEYVLWLEKALGQHSVSSQNSPFPSPVEMYEYSKWRENTSNQRLSEASKVTGRCFHIRHPSDTVSEDTYCPICQVKIHVYFLSVITSFWEDIEDQKNSNGSDMRWVDAKRAWIYARCELANTMITIEDAAIKETLWEIAHPHYDLVDVESGHDFLSFSYNEALKVAMQYISRDHLLILPSFADDTYAKHVHFSDDVVEIEKRPQKRFRRVHHQYEPGKHANPLSPVNPRFCTGWADTSFSSDESFGLRQYKVFSTMVPQDIDDPLGKGTYRGLLGSWELANEVEWKITRSRGSLDRADQKLYDEVKKWSYAIIVLMDDRDRILELRFFEAARPSSSNTSKKASLETSKRRLFKSAKLGLNYSFQEVSDWIDCYSSFDQMDLKLYPNEAQGPNPSAKVGQEITQIADSSKGKLTGDQKPRTESVIPSLRNELKTSLASFQWEISLAGDQVTTSDPVDDLRGILELLDWSKSLSSSSGQLQWLRMNAKP